jgi:hypothetical protein
MNIRIKVALVALAAFAILFPFQKGFCSWTLTGETETINLSRLDTQDGVQKPSEGVYGYYDSATNTWIVVLDFSKSKYPLINLNGATLLWQEAGTQGI